jgi:hypothetical protein
MAQVLKRLATTGCCPSIASRDRQRQGGVEGSGALLGRKLKYYPVAHA